MSSSAENLFNKGSKIPLLDAIKKGDVTLAAKLIREGADVNAKDSDGSTALFWVSQRVKFPKLASLIPLLVEKGANVNAWIKMRYILDTPLLTALSAKNLAAAEELIYAGADVNVEGPNNSSPLSVAAHGCVFGETVEDFIAILPLLLQRGANPNAADDRGVTTLEKMWEGDAPLFIVIWPIIEQYFLPGVVYNIALKTILAYFDAKGITDETIRDYFNNSKSIQDLFTKELDEACKVLFAFSIFEQKKIEALLLQNNYPANINEIKSLLTEVVKSYLRICFFSQPLERLINDFSEKNPVQEKNTSNTTEVKSTTEAISVSKPTATNTKLFPCLIDFSLDSNNPYNADQTAQRLNQFRKLLGLLAEKSRNGTKENLPKSSADSKDQKESKEHKDRKDHKETQTSDQASNKASDRETASTTNSGRPTADASQDQNAKPLSGSLPQFQSHVSSSATKDSGKSTSDSTQASHNSKVSKTT